MENKSVIKRCAIYTRKSVEDEVEKDFNSIDAQREAGEAYVRSQRANGWELIEKRYDDYGYSGGNINRPGLGELLEDCKAGKVDVIVIYKLDRLSRSICDFADLMANFDRWNVSFVAVTQEINTATSAGRMMLNILITFAQYEREVIAERIRDKKAATLKKGKWDGGVVPYGYRVEDHKLVELPEEADIVRFIFDRYLAIQSPKQIALELIADGKTYRHEKPWTAKQISSLLRRPVYIGKVTYKKEVYNGEHKGIVNEETWQTVQKYIDSAPQANSKERSINNYSPLKGVLRCGHCDCAMTPTFTYKGNRKYCFYICVNDAKRAESECPVKRIAASEIEKYVFEQLGRVLRAPEIVTSVAGLIGEEPQKVMRLLKEVYPSNLTQGEKKRLAELLVEVVEIRDTEIMIELKTGGIEKIVEEAYEN